MANELVYYGISSENNRRIMEERPVDVLHGCGELNDADDRVIAVTPSFDPVEILPPELSLSCLLDALQSGANDRLYQPDLLQMLNVSKKWFHYMISTPLLWSEIHIDSSTPDLLATLATFIHLSCAAPLRVFFWGDPGASWDDIGTILLPHSQRIGSLNFKPTSYPGSQAERTAHLLLAKRVLGFFRCLAGLKELDFSVPLDLQSFDLGLPIIPQGLLVQNALDISLSEGNSMIASPQIYATITTRNCLGEIIPLLSRFSVRDLGLYGHKETQMSASKIEIPPEAVSRLKRITYHQPDCIGLGRLLMLTAHQLFYLELGFSDLKTQEIIDMLSKLVKLKHLQLYLGQGATTETAQTSHLSCGAVIHDLDTLHVYGDQKATLSPLFTAFITMYPSVRHLKISGFSKSSQIFAAYLASLAYLETLHFHHRADLNSLQPIVQLPSLQSLSALWPHTLQYLELPNLLDLALTLTQATTRLNSVRLPCLRRFTIHGSRSHFELHLEPFDYPELRTLTISHSKLRWQLSSLPKLVLITLNSFIYKWDRHKGTLLCAALLYHPEYCPALQQIRFSQPVQWDILFLMLERRNCKTEYVNRINVVSLPFVPFILRKPLALLLEGRSAERPSNLELSFEGSRELVCDATIPGCLWCLRYMRPHCMELEKPRPVSTPLELGKAFVEYPDPPGDVPIYIRDWVFQYQHLREEWKHLQIYRSELCPLWR